MIMTIWAAAIWLAALASSQNFHTSDPKIAKHACRPREQQNSEHGMLSREKSAPE
jgi:hypothetical protein